MLPGGTLQGEISRHETVTGGEAAWGDVNMTDMAGGDNALCTGDITLGDVDRESHCRGGAALFESSIVWGYVDGRHWKGRKHALQLQCYRRA